MIVVVFRIHVNPQADHYITPESRHSRDNL